MYRNARPLIRQKNTGLANEEAVPARALMRGRALWYAPLVRACSWLAAALTVAVIAFGWLAHTGARLDWYDYARMSSMLSLAGIAIFFYSCSGASPAKSTRSTGPICNAQQTWPKRLVC
ncbi:hypothetical protein ACFS07_00075 [Undibacterium arcticum]